ncbi:putative WRKY transcription factor 27, partial [Mucuna pruriens]
MAHEDWDLFAIVRSCKAATFTATTNIETPPTTTTSTTTLESPDTPSCLDAFTVNQENGSFSFPNLVQPTTNGFQELHQLLRNFNPTTSTITSTITSGLGINPNSTFSDVAEFIGQQQIQQCHHHHLDPAPTNHTSIRTPSTSTSFDRFQNTHHQQQHPQTPDQHQQQQNQPPQTSPILSPNTQPQPPRSRKRKSQQKKMVCHVTADNLSSDLWAWRKYGQKPIKGSPYPRCSSCKGCAARKQVERSTTEPNTFIVTYTGDHKHAKPVHRNSLAGSTRTKPSPTPLPETKLTGPCITEENACSSTSELSPMLLNSGTPENEAKIAVGEPDSPSENDDNDVLIPNTGAMSDAVLLGLTNIDRDGGYANALDPNSTSGSVQSRTDPFSNPV